MPIKPNTRDYGKDHPRFEGERSVGRAGESDLEARGGWDGINPWLAKKDPYSSDEEVDPPSDAKDNNRVWPEDLPSKPADKEA